MNDGVSLDGTRLLAGLGRHDLVRDLVLRGRVDSTNSVARELASRGAPEGTVVLAEEQSAGRGRRGRTWHSPRGAGLYVSVVLRPRAPLSQLTRWTVAAGLAACEACRSVGAAEAEIRWPNDVVWRSAKLGGVLVETRTAGDEARDMIVGAGINVSHGPQDFPRELQGRATSLRMASSSAPAAREQVAAAYLDVLAELAAQLSCGAWKAIAERWHRLAPGASGLRVRIWPRGDDGTSWEGVTSGLDEIGALRVRDRDGRERAVHLAESVRAVEV